MRRKLGIGKLGTRKGNNIFIMLGLAALAIGVLIFISMQKNVKEGLFTPTSTQTQISSALSGSLKYYEKQPASSKNTTVINDIKNAIKSFNGGDNTDSNKSAIINVKQAIKDADSTPNLSKALSLLEPAAPVAVAPVAPVATAETAAVAPSP